MDGETNKEFGAPKMAGAVASAVPGAVAAAHAARAAGLSPAGPAPARANIGADGAGAPRDRVPHAARSSR